MHSGVACFHKSDTVLIIVSIITLSLCIAVFFLWHISCSPWSAESVQCSDFWLGCDTAGRCGQDSYLMPVKDKRVSVRWDARHTSACMASSVWGLAFVCFLLIFHSCCLSVWMHAHAAGCSQRSCRRNNWISVFFLGVYPMHVFKQKVYTFGLSLSLPVGSVAQQSCICIWSHFWRGPAFFSWF